MRSSISLAVGVAAFLSAPLAQAQTQLITAPNPVLSAADKPLPLPTHSYVLPLGKTLTGIFNPMTITVPVAETIVYKQGAVSLQLDFDQVQLPKACYLEVQSLQDNDRQLLSAERIDAGVLMTAFFNGPALRVRLFAAPGTKPSANIKSMSVEFGPKVGPLSICGSTDNRYFTNYRHVCRLILRRGTRNSLCTGWLVSRNRSGHVTAGHCLSGTTGVTAQYNVPRSTSSGAIRNPPSADQYGWISSTRRFSNRGVGNDWGVFRTSRNPWSRQRTYFRLRSPTTSRTMRRSGFGSASGSKNFSQKSHGGRLSTIRRNYIAYNTIDSTGGDSGGPVHYGGIYAVGIHTHGGCTRTGGSNKATNVNLRAFRNAYNTVR